MIDMHPSKGYLEFAVLKILENNPMHGYKMAKELEKRLKWKPSPGSLYPILASLEKEKLIIGHELVEYSKFKKIYKITKKGKEKLASWRKQFRDFITFMGFK